MSAQQTTENFWQVWNSFGWPEPKTVSYRCYYGPDGQVELYTMDDLPGDYIEVTKEAYLAARYNAKVQDGVLKILPRRQKIDRLERDQSSGTRCDLRDVCVVVDNDRPGTHWDIKQYDID